MTTTSGLSSAYQLTEVTGALTASVSTGGQMTIGGRIIPNFPVMKSASFRADKNVKTPQKVVEIVEVTPDETPVFAQEDDPARAEFVGPLGMPASHAQRAQRLQTYRAVTEGDYDDIAEGIL